MRLNTSYNCFIIIFSFILFILIPQVRILLIFIVWLSIFFEAWRKIRERVVLFSFCMTFFTFLLGRLVLPLFASLQPDYHENMSGFNDDLWNFTYYSLFISLVFVYFGFILGEKSASKELYLRKDQNFNYIAIIRSLSKKLVYLSFIFKLLTTVEIIWYVYNNGYLALYLEPPHTLPYVVYKMADLFTLSVYIFMATMPNKKESRFVLALYLLDSVLSIFTGRRGTFMFAALVLFIYMYIRNSISPNEGWITNRMKRIGIAAVPFVLIGMYFIGFVRAEAELDDSGASNALLSFFYSQGGSVQLIGLTKESIDKLPNGQCYLLGPILHIFDGTTIGNILGFKSYEPQSPALAMHGDSLGDYLTYRYNPTRYLSGGGYGSCYIAEAYADLGIIGIALVSYVLGWLLSRFKLWMLSNVWLSTLSFYMLFGILHAPRGQAFSFLKEMLTPTTIIIMFLIHYYATRRKKVKLKSS